MQLRVRSLCGAELVLDVPHHRVRVPVADIKRRALCELLRLRCVESRQGNEETKDSEDKNTGAATTNDAALDRSMAGASLIFRGQLLADVDDVNLFALAPSDFFVLIEDDHTSDGGHDDKCDDDDDVVIVDAPDSNTATHKRAKTSDQSNGAKSKTMATVRDSDVVQLMDMGFPFLQAQDALQSANGDLQNAVAILMGEQQSSTSTQDPAIDSGSKLQEYVAGLLIDHPELRSIESLLVDEGIHTVKRIAQQNSDFEALVLLKESMLPHTMSQMIANPLATVSFLSLPSQYVPPPRPRQTVDLTGDTPGPKVEAKQRMQHHDAIERLTSMGFDASVVHSMYEACGHNEALTATMLFESMEDQE